MVEVDNVQDAGTTCLDTLDELLYMVQKLFPCPDCHSSRLLATRDEALSAACYK